jgi:hypothetical protein
MAAFLNGGGFWLGGGNLKLKNEIPFLFYVFDLFGDFWNFIFVLCFRFVWWFLSPDSDSLGLFGLIGLILSPNGPFGASFGQQYNFERLRSLGPHLGRPPSARQQVQTIRWVETSC